jgi:hypothetical protein
LGVCAWALNWDCLSAGPILPWKNTTIGLSSRFSAISFTFGENWRLLLHPLNFFSLVMAEDIVHRTYAALLKWHNKGFALWEPFSSPTHNPGSVGFFDGKARWQPLYDDIRGLPPSMQFTSDIVVIEDSPETVREFRSRSLQTLDLNVGGALE